MQVCKPDPRKYAQLNLDDASHELDGGTYAANVSVGDIYRAGNIADSTSIDRRGGSQ